MTIGVVHTTPSNLLNPTITATGGPNHSLIVCVNAFKGGFTPVVTGVTLGGVALAAADGQVFGGALSWIYYKSGIASGQTAVVVSGTDLQVDSSDGGVDIIEVDCPIVLDKSNHNAGNGLSASTGSSGILSVAEEIAIGAIDGLDITDTAAGWVDFGGGGGTEVRLSSYKVVSATTALNLTGSNGSTTPWTAAIATFRRGAAGVAPGGFMDCLV